MRLAYLPFEFDPYSPPEYLGTGSNLRFCYTGFRFYVCNPTTRQFKIIPFPPNFDQDNLNLVFDPSRSRSPHFKIVQILPGRGDGSILHIYDSQTNAWNPSPIPFDKTDPKYYCLPVVCRGAIHWHSDMQTSLYFDVYRECFNTMPIPKSVNP